MLCPFSFPKHPHQTLLTLEKRILQPKTLLLSKKNPLLGHLEVNPYNLVKGPQANNQVICVAIGMIFSASQGKEAFSYSLSKLSQWVRKPKILQ